MNLKKKTGLLMILTLALWSANCQHKGAEAPMRSEAQMVDLLVESVNERDFSKIKAYLADDYQYEGYDGAMAINVLNQVISQYPAITAYTILETSSNSHNTKIDFTITTKNGIETKSLWLNANRKVLRADIANISVQGHGASKRKERTSASGMPDPMKQMSFKLGETGQMLVKASVNGKVGTFVIDSGTPTHLMLNASYYELAGEELDRTPLGVSGVMEDVSKVRINDFEWQGITFDGLDAIVTDVGHLGERMSIPDFGGTIGYDLLKEFALDFDYSTETLRLWTDTQEMRRSYQVDQTQVLPMNMVHHIPVIRLKIGDDEVRLGIDSGAEGNMLQPEWEEKLEGQYVNKRKEELGGADNNYALVSKATIEEVNINGKVLALDFLFAGLFGGDHEVELLDGLIGLQFLKAQRTILNLRDNELYLLN